MSSRGCEPRGVCLHYTAPTIASTHERCVGKGVVSLHGAFEVGVVWCLSQRKVGLQVLRTKRGGQLEPTAEAQVALSEQTKKHEE